jgi:UDP-N-acetylmuramoyl-L-alanyl-D-glutamate--2,6-diaminopimelate ligase
MDDYFAAKARLFTPELSRSGVISVDDAWGRKLAAAAAIPVRTVGSVEGGWRWSDVRPIGMQNEVTLTSPDGGQERLNVSLPGRFNVANAALAYVALVTAGIDPDAARDGIASVVRVPGRMERVDAGQPFVAMVDYAHTPEAVALLLAEARALAAPHGRVVVVLGCGGDRDQGKRPAMGAAAARGADVAVFTNDNPRSEDPAVILDALVAGATEVASDAVVEVEPDRRAAIGLAVAECRPGDVLVIAGKGHEQGQETAGRVVPFDDRDVLRSCLAGLAGAAGRT